MNCVLIIFMERHLTFTLTSVHICSTRNEFLTCDLYENMVLRINIALLLIFFYHLPSPAVAILDFDELQEFSKMSSWATLLKYMPNQQFMEHLK